MPRETLRNPPKPSETTFSQRNQPKPKMGFCDAVSLHRKNTKTSFIISRVLFN